MNRPIRTILVFALLVATTSGADLGRAQPAESGAAARAAFAKGQQAVNERQFVTAIEAFKQAYRLRPHYLVMCSIARCYQNLNDMVKAAEHYRRCLKEGAAKSKMAERVTASLQAVESHITWLKVRSPGPGGVVFVDGQEAGAAPRRVPLNPGLHVIEVRREGARPARAKLKTLGGEEREVALVPEALTPKVAAPPASQPAVAVTGRDTGEGQRRGLPQYWFWSAAGATVALAVVAVVLGVQTLGYGADYDEDPTEETYNNFVDRRLLTNIFWAATVVAAGGSTALFFYTDFGGKGGEETGEAAAMTIGITWRGSF